MEKTKKNVLCLLSICAVALLLGACNILGDAAKLEVYDFGSDRIPTINSVVGERKVTGVETGTRTGGVQYKNYTYETQTLTEDMDAYYFSLQEAGFLVTKSSDGNTLKGTLEMGCNSADEGKLILVGLAWDNTIITISIVKGEGSVTPNG